MKLAMTTLGAPGWDLETISERGQEYGFDGVDFRGYGDEIDVTRLPAFTDRAGETRAALADAGLAVSGISSSISVCEPEALQDHVAEARRTIAVADAFDAEYVRVFGGGDRSTHGRTAMAEFAAETMDAILSLDGARGLRWVVETHDNWIAAEHCRLLLDAIGDPAVGVLWDAGHTTRVGEEHPEETLDDLGDSIEYVHLKDASYDPTHPDAMDDGWRYVLPGEGELPLGEVIDVLRSREYDGWLVFEHEKRWHPELPEPEVAFPTFVEWFEAQ